MINLSQKLTKSNKPNRKGIPLTKRRKIPFKISIEESLDNKYCFKKLKGNSIQEFHKFIEATIGKGLSITEVETMYLRTKGTVKETIKVNGIERDVIHFGKDRNPFRIFGYYNQDYFVLNKIDPTHKVHRS